MIDKEERRHAALKYRKESFKGDEYSIFDKAIYRKNFESGIDYVNDKMVEAAKKSPLIRPAIRAFSLNSKLTGIELDGGKYCSYSGKMEPETRAILIELGIKVEFNGGEKYTLSRKK